MKKTFVSEIQVRKEICEYGQKLYDKGFVAANDGNISAKISEDIIIVTPTGVSKGGMKPDDLVKMRLSGEILSHGAKPSSEVKMHIEVYNKCHKLKAVVHAHPPMSTAFAVARKPLDRPILSEAIMTLGVVPVAEYAKPGTDEVPQSISGYVLDYNAVLLANHGLLTWGEDLQQAFFRMESAEHYSKILHNLELIGGAKELDCSEVNELVNIRESWGVTTGGAPPCDVNRSGITKSDEQTLVEEITKRVMQHLEKR